MSSTTTRTRTREEQQHACPYAAALSSSTDDNTALQLQCPAFADGTCPFKDATTATAMKQKLQQMPESHMKHSSSFVHLLQEMHQVQAPAQDVFHIPGGCPVMSNDKSVSFREALEEMSLAAIMAKLMEQTENKDDDDNEEAHKEQEHTFDETLNITTPQQQQQQQQHTLSESLKTGTARSHQAAENVHFVQNFIQGKIDRDLYAALVGMLYHVYVKLEVLLDQHAPESFPSCHFPVELRRTETLAQDVDFWHGTVVPVVSAATQDYMDRLQFIATTDPLLLLAHAYTRYLGDLSGGKVLARVARRALSLKDGDGLDFYAFRNISSVKLFKDKYRNALDALSLNADQVQRVVAEANVAFCLNMRLFEELDVQANVPGAVVRPLDEALAFATLTPSTVHTPVSEECPFLKKSSKNKTAAVSVTKRCPWPFVLAHDPVQGMKDWQTWLVLGLILCWIWSMLQRNNNSNA